MSDMPSSSDDGKPSGSGSGESLPANRPVSPRLQRLAAIASALAAAPAAVPAVGSTGLNIVPNQGAPGSTVTSPVAPATLPTRIPPFGQPPIPSRRVWIYDPPPPPPPPDGNDGGHCDAHGRSGTDHH